MAWRLVDKDKSKAKLNCLTDLNTMIKCQKGKICDKKYEDLKKWLNNGKKFRDQQSGKVSGYFYPTF